MELTLVFQLIFKGERMTKKYTGTIKLSTDHSSWKTSNWKGHCIWGYDEESQKVFETWSLGDLVTVEKRSKRSQRQHRMYWALIGLVLDNQDYFQSKDQLSHYIKLKIGHVDIVKYKDEVIEIPKSISFSSTKQEEFNSFIDRAIDFIISDEGLWPGVERDTVLNEVYDIIGINFA